jgi:hypothetical protein
MGVVGLLLLVAGGTTAAAPRPSGVPAAAVTVLATVHPLAVGQVLKAADLVVQRVGSPDDLGDLARSPGDVVGRRVLVALPQGVLVERHDVADAAGDAGDGRVVRLQVDRGAAPAQLVSGQSVDVIAAVVDPQAPGGGRVEHLAVARILSATPTGSLVTLVLGVDASAVDRLLWGQAFAKSLTIVARPPGEGGSP